MPTTTYGSEPGAAALFIITTVYLLNIQRTRECRMIESPASSRRATALSGSEPATDWPGLRMDSFALLLQLTGYQIILFGGNSKIGLESYGSEQGRGSIGRLAIVLKISPRRPGHSRPPLERIEMAGSLSMTTEMSHFASTMITLIALRNSLRTTWWKPNRAICGLEAARYAECLPAGSHSRESKMSLWIMKHFPRRMDWPRHGQLTRVAVWL